MTSPQLSFDEPLSPELALVCPELAERARAALPDPGWLAPVVRIEPKPPRTRPLPTLLFALLALFMTLTPLALLVLHTSPTLR